MLLLLSKTSLCMWISTHFFQGSICLIDMRCCWHVPNSYRNKNLKSFNPYLLLKLVFLAPRTLLYLQKTFFSTLNLIIFQMVWNECVRFGGHINIKFSNKILQLKIQKKATISHNLPCFQESLFWGNFWTQRGHWCLGINKTLVERFD